MTHKLLAPAAFAALFLAASCGKDEDNGVVLAGGRGGSAILKVNTLHHTKRIDSITVYIKYAAQDAPGNGRYDDSAHVVKGIADTVATFTGLKAGRYYLYGKGWDPRINEGVQGGAPYTIATDSTNLTINLPVSEGD